MPSKLTIDQDLSLSRLQYINCPLLADFSLVFSFLALSHFYSFIFFPRVYYYLFNNEFLLSSHLLPLVAIQWLMWLWWRRPEHPSQQTTSSAYANSPSRDSRARTTPSRASLCTHFFYLVAVWTRTFNRATSKASCKYKNLLSLVAESEIFRNPLYPFTFLSKYSWYLKIINLEFVQI